MPPERITPRRSPASNGSCTRRPLGLISASFSATRRRSATPSTTSCATRMASPRLWSWQGSPQKQNVRDGRSPADHIARRFGLHATDQFSLELPGEAGTERISRIMTALRSSPPAELLGYPVTEIDDAATGIHRTADGHEATLELPRGDVLIWRSGERARVVVRPSGTEPKLKVYLQVVLAVGELGDVRAITKAAASELSRLRHDLHAVLEPDSAGAPTTETRRELAAMIDHTLLKPEATADNVAALCEEARELHVCAVCISPTMVALASDRLRGSPVKVASVIGFPAGAHRSEVEGQRGRPGQRRRSGRGRHVINLGLALPGDWDGVRADITAVREVLTDGQILKVIIETAVLTPSQITAACHAAETAGADFAKLRQGSIPPAAPPAKPSGSWPRPWAGVSVSRPLEASIPPRPRWPWSMPAPPASDHRPPPPSSPNSTNQLGACSDAHRGSHRRQKGRSRRRRE